MSKINQIKRELGNYRNQLESVNNDFEYFRLRSRDFSFNLAVNALYLRYENSADSSKRTTPDWNVYNNIARLQRGRRDCAPAIGGMETTRVVAISFSLCNKSTSPSKGQVCSKRAGDGLSFLSSIILIALHIIYIMLNLLGLYFYLQNQSI